MTEAAEVAVQVDQHVVIGQHPEGFVDVEELANLCRILVEHLGKILQFLPTIFGFQFVKRIVADRILAQVFQAGIVACFTAAGSVFLPVGIAFNLYPLVISVVFLKEIIVYRFRQIVEPQVLVVDVDLGKIGPGSG